MEVVKSVRPTVIKNCGCRIEIFENVRQFENDYLLPEARGLVDDQYVVTLNDCMFYFKLSESKIVFLVKAQLVPPYVEDYPEKPEIYHLILYINKLVTDNSKALIKVSDHKVKVGELDLHINKASFRYLISAAIYSGTKRFYIKKS